MEPIFSSAEKEHQSSFSRRDLFNIVFKHKYVILITFLLVSILVWWGIFSLPPVYTSTGKVLIKTEQQGNPMFFSGVAAYQEQQQSDPVNRKMETEMQLVEARPIAEQVVEELQLGYWDVYHKPYVHLLRPVADFYDEIMLEKFGIPTDPEKRGFSDTVTELIKSISIAPVKSKSSETTSNIVQLELKAPSAELSTVVLQKIMEVYRDHDIRIKQEAAERAYSIVEAKTTDAYLDLIAAQENLEKLLSNQANNSIKNTITTPGDTATIALLKEQLIEREKELTDASVIYKPGSERIANIQKAIRELKARISAESNQFAETDTRLITLEREVTSAETVYLELKKRMSQIELYMEMNERRLGNRIIVEPAIKPRESSWKKDIVLAVLGSFAGLVLGLGMAGFREYMDHTVNSKDQVNRLFGMDVLGTVDWIDKLPEKKYSRPDRMETSA
ncbi:GumC family protein [Methylophaga nitratireducenticrescens]|uniref:Tyrosine-protein kinase Wzc n=1 Tax=Methylophaga nitratireducenticrescens TaxID=754476 RepID=I1XIN9_METNJ|nr:Wzz/FepE/Etk N-terminal domain-containing protein [Methylophaga nitratireducenticrescens]AUZ84336.1 hypothetical protein CDW43_06965 [Methylophaga nitratireducenticrescens]